MKPNVVSQLAALQSKNSEELKIMWRELFKTEPPHAHKAYLVSRLSYRTQELIFGGLSERTRTKLENMVKKKVDQPKPAMARPPIGTELIRRFNGVDHHVSVLHDGFEYQGQKYKSLSKIARFITGTQWNGPLFFGLRGKIS